MEYTKVRIVWDLPSEEKSEIIIALLGEMPFNSFENTETSVNAYLPTKNFDTEIINEIETYSETLGFSFTIHAIPFVNWNTEWEKNYSSVVVDDFVGIRASFHPIIENVNHEIIINPRMAFGTGHHATTYTVIQMMQELDFKNKTVLDFGCGSGVLAIVAEKLGASQCLAIDNDQNCIENTTDNIKINHCRNIKTQLTSIETLHPTSEYSATSLSFDIIIANINRNVLSATFKDMALRLKKNGFLIISGFYNTDENILLEVAKQNNLHLKSVKQKDGWSCLCFSAGVQLK